MTRKEMAIELDKQRNTIDRQKQLLNKCVEEIDGMHLSLKSSRMFAAAVMTIAGYQTISIPRKQLDHIVNEKDVEFKQVLDAEGIMTGVELRIVDAKHEMEIEQDSRE